MLNQAHRILVYLSHPDVLHVTVFRLRLLGMDAVPVSRLDAMTDEIASKLPDLVIVDLDFDDDAGIDLVESISSDDCTSQVPILCMAGGGDLQQVEDAYKAGARGFLIIPYDPVQLEDQIYSMLRDAEVLKKTYRPGALSAVTTV